jgi:hypothetical protein
VFFDIEFAEGLAHGAFNGAGDAKLSGRTKAVSVTVNGAGDVDLSRLDYENLEKSINGIGSVKTAPKKAL